MKNYRFNIPRDLAYGVHLVIKSVRYRIFFFILKPFVFHATRFS